MTRDPLWTARLRLDAWDAPVHTGLLERLVAEPSIMRFVGDGRPLDPAGVAERASFATAHWLARGWGWRVGSARDGSGGPVVLVAANRLGTGHRRLRADEHELGWFVAPQAQGLGLAAEAAGAVVDELLGRVGAPSVLARIQPANAASVRVATALGMERDGTTTGRFGEPMHVYRRTADPAAGAARVPG